MNIILKQEDDKYELEWRYRGKSYITTHDTREQALLQVDENNRNRDIFLQKDKIIKRAGFDKSEHMKTIVNAVHKMLDPAYREREASFRCATANTMAGYHKYELQPITNKIVEKTTV